MAKFTLSDIKAAAERKYSSTVYVLSDGTECVLPNLLNLDEKVGNKVEKALKDLSATGDDDEKGDVSSVRTAASTVLRLVAGERNGDKILDELGGSLASIITLIEEWSSASQVGEASPSDN